MRSTRRPILTHRVEAFLRAGAVSGEIYEALEDYFPRTSIAVIISKMRRKLGKPEVYPGRALKVWLTASQRAQLAAAAEEYGISDSTLASRIIAAVVDDDMFAAVIGPAKPGRDKSTYKTGAAAPRN